MSDIEQTLSIIKPDAVERHLEEEIKNEFLKNNFKIIKEKKIKLEKQEAEKFYQVHQTKPFYNDLCNYLSSGPIVVMILEGENAVLKNREIKAIYPDITFTDNPWSRATMGCSSGGAAALTMGWFRPDLFRRIITYSGTFVDQQDDDAPEELMYPFFI